MNAVNYAWLLGSLGVAQLDLSTLIVAHAVTLVDHSIALVLEPNRKKRVLATVHSHELGYVSVEYV